MRSIFRLTLALFTFICLSFSTTVHSADPLFSTYVALGDSLTQGNQGGSVEETRQSLAYPALLAQLMGTDYNQATLTFPGNKVNIEDFIKGNIKWWQYYYVLIGGHRKDRFQTQENLSNFGITGAEASDLLANSGDTGMYKLVLGKGGKPAVDQATDRSPTFATVWIGSNSVLKSVIFGDERLMTPIETFRTNIQQLADKLAATESLQGVAIANIPNVTEIALLMNSEAGGKQHQWAGMFADNEDISENTLTTIHNQVLAMNVIIEEVAAQHGWALVDLYSEFENIIENDHVLTRADGSLSDQIITRDYLGGLFSLDGMHLSTTGQAIFANFFINNINDFFNTDLANVDETVAASQDTLMQTPVDPRSFF
ncbi:MAG: hypothetical protein HN790_11465 [Methylococcales bacterium]|jgi:lysophospholipase L1-like esterase|nr:hypothetical protein [Methylococcales bacterium]